MCVGDALGCSEVARTCLPRAPRLGRVTVPIYVAAAGSADSLVTQVSGRYTMWAREVARSRPGLGCGAQGMRYRYPSAWRRPAASP